MLQQITEKITYKLTEKYTSVYKLLYNKISKFSLFIVVFCKLNFFGYITGVYKLYISCALKTLVISQGKI